MGRTIGYFAIVLSLLCVACTGPQERAGDQGTGVYHCVEAGETLWSIARLYGLDAATLARVNGIEDPASLSADAILFIPGAGGLPEGDGETESPGEKTVTKPPPGKAPLPKATAKIPEERKKEDKTDTKFIWPIRGAVLASFGRQSDGMVYNGIRIRGKEGTSVRASASGTVIHSAVLKYYGGTVILKHEGNYCTVYAHLKDRAVKVGDRIRQGEPIARLGKDDKEGIPCLHFEIRKRNSPRNPLNYLPPLKDYELSSNGEDRKGKEKNVR